MNYPNRWCPGIAEHGITATTLATNAIKTRHLTALNVTNAKMANGNIGLGSGNSGSTLGKLNAKYVEFSTAVTDTIVTVPHGLARTPVGYLTIRSNKAAWLYDATAVFNTTNLWVKTPHFGTVVYTIMVW